MHMLSGSGSCSNVTDSKLLDLKILNVYDGELETLRDDDLAGLFNLEDLRITGANLHTIESGAFTPVNQTLKSATFTHNDLEPSDLSELTSNLESLSLAHNTITSLGANAFGRFTNLELLNLSGNPITSLHGDAFDGLYGLKSLSLGGYNPPSSLGGPRRLTLSANQFADNLSLQGLSLSNSGITAIPNNTFNNLYNLERLYLNDNDLTTLTRDMFHADLGSVQLLELGCNNLTTDFVRRRLAKRPGQSAKTVPAPQRPGDGRYIGFQVLPSTQA